MSCARIPVMVLTGFLGSGKTTLLNRLLRDPDWAETAVLVSEFGEIGLDHHLLERVDGETVLLEGGCICCGLRDSWVQTLVSLLQRVRSGALPPLRRVVVETTGLADPGPILAALQNDARLSAEFSLAAVITTADSVHGMRQLNEHFECLRQLAVADHIVVTKQEMASPAALAQLTRRIRALNPHARILAPAQAVVSPQALMIASGWGSGRPACQEMRVGHPGLHCHDACSHEQEMAESRHDRRIQSHSFVIEEPADWDVVSHWLGSLAYFHGKRILRIKGVVCLAEDAGVFAVHGVHGLLHEPAPLAGWPDGDRSSRFVFITCDLGRDVIEEALYRACRDVGAGSGLSENQMLGTSVQGARHAFQ